VIRRSALGALVDVLSFVGKTGELTVGSSANGGRVALLTPAGEAIVLRGGDATAVVGVEGKEGHVKVCDTAGVEVVHLDGANANVTIGATGREGDVIVRDADGATRCVSTPGAPQSMSAPTATGATYGYMMRPGPASCTWTAPAPN
jgi:hypothetical protein